MDIATMNIARDIATVLTLDTGRQTSKESGLGVGKVPLASAKELGSDVRGVIQEERSLLKVERRAVWLCSTLDDPKFGHGVCKE
jgi:hypothetical protein